MGIMVLLRHALAFMNGRKTVIALTVTEKLNRLWRICLADGLAIDVPYREILGYGHTHCVVNGIGDMK